MVSCGDPSAGAAERTNKNNPILLVGDTKLVSLHKYVQVKKPSSGMTNCHRKPHFCVNGVHLRAIKVSCYLKITTPVSGRFLDVLEDIPQQAAEYGYATLPRGGH